MQNEGVKIQDEELVRRAQDGDKSATEELLRRHADTVRSCARGFFLIGGETEDLIQEGMIGLYQAIVDYRAGEASCSFKNFAYLCVSRKIIDAVRVAASKKNAALNAGILLQDAEALETEFKMGPEELLILDDERKEIKHIMSRTLSDFEFKITMMYVDGMSCAEICEATGKTPKSVDNALQRSKRKLQQVLKR